MQITKQMELIYFPSRQPCFRWANQLIRDKSVIFLYIQDKSIPRNPAQSTKIK